MISGCKPDRKEAELGIEIYLGQGPLMAIVHSCKSTGSEHVQSADLCLGGTFLPIVCVDGSQEHECLISMAFLAALTDFG